MIKELLNFKNRGYVIVLITSIVVASVCTAHKKHHLTYLEGVTPTCPLYTPS